MTITTLKEKLVKRLLEGTSDFFTEFVSAVLEDELQTIILEIEWLLKVKHLTDHQWQDLTELTLDGQATIRVLRYYTGHDYTPESTLINTAIDKGKEWI